MTRFRNFFASHDFVEVDTASLQVSPGNEAHLHAFETCLHRPQGSRQTLYLHTSPEFACKKLLVAGEKKIVFIGKVYRNRERGALHHPEFTMVEWYRTGEGYEALMNDCATFIQEAAETTGAAQFSFRGRVMDPFKAPERLSVEEAFDRYAGINLDRLLDHDGAPNREAFSETLKEAGIRQAPDDTWSDMFSRVMVERVEPKLGLGQATILDLYPLHEAALARPSAKDHRFAERFELYACGVELANAFGELTDAAEQRRRFEAEMAEKKRLYNEIYPLDEEFLAALPLMPPASGAALGFDRLAMLATGATRVDQVIWSPVEDQAP